MILFTYLYIINFKYIIIFIGGLQVFLTENAIIYLRYLISIMKMLRLENGQWILDVNIWTLSLHTTAWRRAWLM